MYLGGASARDPDRSTPMAEFVHDPVNQVRYSFRRDGENLIVDCLVDSGGALPPHLHPRQVECWSVVDGQVRFRLGDQERVIDTADGEMVVTPGTAHGLANVSGRAARLRCRVEPALRLQAFLEESAAAARDGLFTSRGLPRGLGGARWAARFLDRYRGETDLLSPPQPVQRALIALLAGRDPSPR
jgi:quercetin dioxygenase-like cupin family protein